MGIIKCFDIAAAIIDEASERFRPIWKIDNEKMDVFEQYCEAIDSLAKEFDGESFEVEVNEITMEVIVALECDEIIIESSSHVFNELAKKTEKCVFSTSEEGNLLVKFIFPSLWRRA